jgi:hypothetical protein
MRVASAVLSGHSRYVITAAQCAEDSAHITATLALTGGLFIISASEK